MSRENIFQFGRQQNSHGQLMVLTINGYKRAEIEQLFRRDASTSLDLGLPLQKAYAPPQAQSEAAFAHFL